MEFGDGSLVETASGPLASGLMRRHPNGLRSLRGHPGGGGQYELLWMRNIPQLGPDVRLNRTGTIQVHGREDGVATFAGPPPGEATTRVPTPKNLLSARNALLGDRPCARYRH